jgi:hypothetical protein
MAGKGDQGKNVGKPGKPGWQPTDKSKAAGKTPPPSGPIVPADVEPQAAPDIQAAYLNLMNETHLGSSDLTQPPKLAPVDPRDIGAKEAASGHPTGRNMAGRISVAALRIGDTISLPTMPKGNETVTVEKIGVLGARVVVTVRSLDGTTQKTHMATAGSVLLVEAGPVDTPPIPANPGSHVDAPSIQRAAEDAGVYYEDTYDGVTIGDYSIDATVDGATVSEWHGRGPDARQEFVAHYPDAESAVSAVLSFSL